MRCILAFFALASVLFGRAPGALHRRGESEPAWGRGERVLRSVGEVSEKSGSQMDPDGTP